MVFGGKAQHIADRQKGTKRREKIDDISMNPEMDVRDNTEPVTEGKIQELQVSLQSSKFL